MKAFLSHSSKNKEFVRAIANQLGRQFCIFDEQSFDTGVQFKDSILNGLDESSVFIFFASKESLASMWVEFEMEEAWFNRLSGSLSQSLVYIIDSSIKTDDIPEWLRRGLIRHQNVAKSAARDIRHHIDHLIWSRQHPYFIGRTKDTEAIEQVMSPIDGSSPPHAVFISGLPGIGRRSLVRNAVPKILNLRKSVEILVGEGDSIHDICIAVSNLVEPYSTKDGLERIIDSITRLSDTDAVNRILRNVRLMVRNNEIPMFIDAGGLLDSEGYVRQPVLSIISKLEINDEAYIFFISHRRPQRSPSNELQIIFLQSLHKEDTQRLITMLCNKNGIVLSVPNVNEISEYVAGYPPAIYYAIQQVKDYGVNLVISDKSRLVQFRTNVFMRHIQEQSADINHQGLLRLLATYSPLPLAVIAETLSIDLPTIQNTLIRLIDLAFVVVTPEGFYRIADPIADAAKNTFGFPDEEQHKVLATKLNSYLENENISTSLLDLSRVLFIAARMAKDNDLANKTIRLSNDIIRLTETLYHERRYNEAVIAGYAALVERPDSPTARNYLIRSLIQEERWEEAESQIENMRQFAAIRDVYFINGFLERNRGRTNKAIQLYTQAEKNGRRGVALQRELALCFFLEGEEDAALSRINAALDIQGDNRYVVDLWAKIATKRKDEIAARQALARLELLDSPLYYHHRLSCIEFAFGNLSQALNAARIAVDLENNPPFHILAQKAHCEIETNNFHEAEEALQRIDRRFGNTHRDIRLALRCKLDIVKGNYKQALELSERINDKTTFYYKKIKRDAIEGELLKSAMSDAQRAAYEDELSALDSELAGINADQFLPIELDNTF